MGQNQLQTVPCRCVSQSVNPVKKKVKAVFDEEDGSIIDEEIPNSNASECYIPESIHEHVDSIYLSFDLDDINSILCFMYETSHETLYVWTSPEAMEYYNNYYYQFC